MFKYSPVALAIFSAIILTCNPIRAEPVRIGDLVIDQPTIRATAPGAKVGAGYVKITNMGKDAERLTGGSSLVAGRVEIHEMKMTGEIMKMNEIEGGLKIPAGTTVSLAPGGNHIMFMRLRKPLIKGQQHGVNLVFENAGSIELVFEVKSIGETMKMKSDATRGRLKKHNP